MHISDGGAVHGACGGAAGGGRGGAERGLDRLDHKRRGGGREDSCGNGHGNGSSRQRPYRDDAGAEGGFKEGACHGGGERGGIQLPVVLPADRSARGDGGGSAAASDSADSALGRAQRAGFGIPPSAAQVSARFEDFEEEI